MKYNVLFLLIIMLTLNISVQAQRGVRIAYIDTEYILENVPEYQDAMAQLEAKTQNWKNDIQGRLSTIAQKRKDLSNEKVLLTKELIEEREEDITFEEKEILDYQQKRFGPNGDLIIQQKQLMQPIQDQIFAAVQDMAANYDFIFDKSADLVMLYSAKRYDISDRVLRAITRTSKRTQAQTKAEKRAAKKEEGVPEEINYELEERQKALEEKKKERENAVEKRRQEILTAREAKKKEAEAKREKILEDRAKARQAKIDARNKTAIATESNKSPTTNADKAVENKPKSKEQLAEEIKNKKIAEREKRVKELETRRKKILENRKKALEKRKKTKDSINNSKN